MTGRLSQVEKDSSFVWQGGDQGKNRSVSTRVVVLYSNIMVPRDGGRVSKNITVTKKRVLQVKTHTRLSSCLKISARIIRCRGSALFAFSHAGARKSTGVTIITKGVGRRKRKSLGGAIKLHFLVCRKSIMVRGRL